MTDKFTGELLSRMKPTLQSRYGVAAAMPLEIKLRLERLRLLEIIREERPLAAASETKHEICEAVPAMAVPAQTSLIEHHAIM